MASKIAFAPPSKLRFGFQVTLALGGFLVMMGAISAPHFFGLMKPLEIGTTIVIGLAACVAGAVSILWDTLP